MNVVPPKDRFPRLHRDGTVSYWATDRGEWIAKALFVPTEELQRMHPYDQKRVRKHLGEELEIEEGAA